MIVGITGGTGFIGKALVQKHLTAGDTVRLLTRSHAKVTIKTNRLHVFQSDLTGSKKSLTRFVDGVDVIYHCAGETKNENNMHHVHVEGTDNLITTAANKISHWVQLSSVGAYGISDSGIVTEENQLNPTGVYEETKATADRMVSDAARNGYFTCTILRPSIVFGSAMTNMSLFKMISLIKKGYFFYIGDIGASANYIHVDNVVKGLIMCGGMPEAKGRIYNLSGYKTIEEFVNIIACELNISKPTIRVPKQFALAITRFLRALTGFPLTESRVNALTNRTKYSIDRIQSELGYEHSVSMEEGLKRLVKSWHGKKK